MTMNDFLLKYGTRMVSAALKQLKGEENKEMAADLQAALEHHAASVDISRLSLREVIGRAAE